METMEVPAGLYITSKPNGSKCNINCDYCFYLEKESFFEEKDDFKMDSKVLESYILNYIKEQQTPEIEFAWHGGEPLIRGLEFYENAVNIQKKYKGLKKITNSIQTNGILLNEEWCSFFKENNFLVGLSLDGPEFIHDKYRKDLNGNGTFKRVFNALKLLQKYKVNYNVLACVSEESTKYPNEIYDFFKQNNVEFIQFTPLVERIPLREEEDRGQKFGFMSSLIDKGKFEMTDWSVTPKKYGDFLIKIFDKWVQNDVGKIFIMTFEAALTQWLGNPSPQCIHSKQCGRSLVLEHDGSVFACDHFVYPEYKLGNIMEKTFLEMADESLKDHFGVKKEKDLTVECKQCPVLNLCWGGCPKHRFIKSSDGELNHNYLCKSYKIFFTYISKYLNAMAKLLINGYPASYIMEAVKGPLVLTRKS